MKKLILVYGFCFITSNIFAGGVTDNNNANKGDILVATGQNNGANTIGTWTNSSFLKGDKGDTGSKGEQGQKGDQGLKGDQGIIGPQGLEGKSADNSLVNDLKNKVNSLEVSKYYIVPQVRILDTKKWEVKPYGKFDATENLTFREAGVKVTYKFGKSYEEKRIEELEKRLEMLEKGE